ncbi:hypothetical protein SLNWT_1365 [Streptomyces albus]|uniref:Uncharacterized protein n=1 Tax=Streptomyces albus (strain ATCC 21838 / DSM 41398 / FERM P-419 / JCM 4703 / NBRC 107858) TaxID=1081613 RepID=A0A0B5ESP2_STRA4|nr:hypothetical protein SLNWT_1365 [Streptomyces albus]AOU76057.1 hypothetical protein SLNHY_1366 [Streptomyces albus]
MRFSLVDPLRVRCVHLDVCQGTQGLVADAPSGHPVSVHDERLAVLAVQEYPERELIPRD